MKGIFSMKIKELHIYGYGKWVDQTFTLSSMYHVLYGPNEAGKSTLMSFIQSILFGFPTRHSSALRYEPKESSRYGGKLIVEDERFGEVAIERVDGKATGDVTITLEDGATGSDDLLETLLSGIDRELYQSLFSFRLKDLENVEDLSKEKLDRYFLSAGALGSEKFVSEADRFEAQANKVYKPTGRVPKINQHIQQLKKKQQQLNLAKEKNAHYLSMVKQVDELNDHLKELEKQQSRLEEHIQEMHQVENEWAKVEKINALEHTLSQLQGKELPEDGLYALNHLNKEIEEIRQSIHQLQEKMHSFQEEHRPSKEFLYYLEEREEIEQLKRSLPQLQEDMREKQYGKKEKKRVEGALNKLKLAEGFPLDQALPELWSSEKTREWNEKKEKLLQKQEELKQRLLTITHTLDTQENSIDELEKELWSNEEFKREKALQEEKQPQKSTSSFLLLGIGSGAGLLIFSLFVTGLLQWIGAGIGFLVMILSFIVYSKQANVDQTATSYEAFIQQKEIRKQWRKQLAQVDALEDQKREVQEETEKIEQEHKQLLDHWKQFKKVQGLPDALNLEDSEQKRLTIEEGKQLEKEFSGLKDQVENVEKTINEKVEELAFLDRFFPKTTASERTIDYFTHYLRLIKEEEIQKEQYVKQRETLEQEMKHLVTQERALLQDKQQLLQSADADSEDMFRHYYEEWKKRKAKQQELAQLKQEPMMEEANRFSSLEEIKKEKEKNVDVLRKTKEHAKQLTEEKISLEMEIRTLEEGGEYTSLLQEFENQRSQLQSLVDEWASQKIAAQLIKQTLKHAMEDRLPQTLLNATEYFSYLTDEWYQKILVDEETVRVIHRSGRVFQAEELSRGTAEPLYVALRLAFIKNSQDLFKLPLLVDDGFVNFDLQRKRKVYTLLKGISEDTQVLFFSFDEETLEGLSPSQRTMLQ